MRKLLTFLVSLGIVSALFAAPSLALSPQQREILFGAPGWVEPGAAIDLDFSNGRYYGGSLTGLLSLSRASSETDLLPQSVSGYAYHTYGNNVLALSPFVGLLIYGIQNKPAAQLNHPGDADDGQPRYRHLYPVGQRFWLSYHVCGHRHWLRHWRGDQWNAR